MENLSETLWAYVVGSQDLDSFRMAEYSPPKQATVIVPAHNFSRTYYSVRSGSYFYSPLMWTVLCFTGQMRYTGDAK